MNKIFNIIKRVSIKFYDDSCLVRASGLAYSTLLALVPFITVLYAFGGFDSIGKTIEFEILKAIIPAQHKAVSEALDVFTRNSLATGTLGMVFFLLTSIFLINTIARNFDSIWRVFSNVNFFRRYASYTAILVFGSLLLGVSSSLTSSLEKYISSVSIGNVFGFRDFISLLIPFFITLFIFFSMISIVPSIKVKLKSAMVGALISAVLFEIVKIVFKYWVANSVKTSLIYGSIATIPIFLVGLYLFWLIVLIGVEISYIVQNEGNQGRSTPEELNIEEKIYVGLKLYLLISSSYLNNEVGGITIKELEVKLEVSSLVISSLISIFLEDKLILSINSKHGGYIPGRSLEKLRLSDIVTSIYGGHSRLKDNNGVCFTNSNAFTKGGYDSLDKSSILEILKSNDNILN